MNEPQPQKEGDASLPSAPATAPEQSTRTVPMTTDTKPLASESTHYYFKDGRPCYTVPRANGEGERNTTLADARKLDLVPSYSEVSKVAAKPGLEVWKANQLLDSALTLPMLPGELADDYKKRVIEDAGEKSKKAREKGTELHAAIEEVIRTGVPISEWETHLGNLWDTLKQYGIDLIDGEPEHSFASLMGYGGKIDWHNDEPFYLDFKTTEHLDKKQLVWPEHPQQLSAYGFGHLGVSYSTKPLFRAANVFVGIRDKQVRFFEHSWEDLRQGFAQFRCLLEYWQRIKQFGPYEKAK
jgi:hypothetical protein